MQALRTSCVASILGACPNLGTSWLRQTPLCRQGLSSAGGKQLHGTSQVRDTEATTASPCHRDRNSGIGKRQLVKQLPTHMYMTKEAE